MKPSEKILEDLLAGITNISFGVGGAVPLSHRGIMFGISTFDDIIHHTQSVGEIRSPREGQENENPVADLLRLTTKVFKAVYVRRRGRRRVPPRACVEISFPKSTACVGLRISKRFFQRGFPYQGFTLTCGGLVENHYHDAYLLAFVRLYYEENFLIDEYLDFCVRQRSFDAKTAGEIRKVVKKLLSE